MKPKVAPMEEQFCPQIKKEYIFKDIREDTFPKIKIDLNLLPYEHKDNG